jgi:hypothetical protein
MAAQQNSTLNRCNFHFSIDISDEYHLLLCAGCGSHPAARLGRRKSQRGAGRLTWIDALVNGCTLSTCKDYCDKDLSCIMIYGVIFRFAVGQFGQKTKGSPQGSIVGQSSFLPACPPRYMMRPKGRPDLHHGGRRGWLQRL